MVLSVSHNDCGRLIEVAYEKKIPLFVWGTFGIGKSMVVSQVTKKLGIRLIDARVSQLLPEDLRGLPKTNGDVTKWLPPNWLPTDGQGILFFDELNLAPPSIQAAAYQLVLDRKLGDYVLPDGWVVLAAGNRIEDKANVFELPAPLANRFTHVQVEVPSIEEWTKWAFDNGIDSRIISFLNFKPSRLYSFDGTVKDKAIATPRSWAMFCSPYIDGVTDEGVMSIRVGSSVGEGVAVEFVAFTKLNKDIDVPSILEMPERIKEFTEIDLKYAMLTAFSEYFKKHKDKAVLEKVFNVCLHMEAEFSFLLMGYLKMVDETFIRKEAYRMDVFKQLNKSFSKFVF